MISAIEDKMIDLLEIIGWRGCAKSSFGSVLLPIYAAVEKSEEFPFILPIADTGVQAAINIANIKDEFEHNDLLLQDYGGQKLSAALRREYEDGQFIPDENGRIVWTLESEEEWQAKNMLLANGVRILARSRGQKVRGLRHRQFRPRLAVIDDPEDLEWVQTKENRDKTERWMTGEVLPAMDETFRKVVLLGNWLHRDALMARMKARGRFKVLEYPLLRPGAGTEWERCTWKAKYPSQQKLDEKKQEMGPSAWQREMLLKVIPEEGQIIKEEDIIYYDNMPEKVYEEDPKTHEKILVSNPILSVGVGNDLAIGKKQANDYTTFVPGVNAIESGQALLFLVPNPVNERLNFKETITRAKIVASTLESRYASPMFFMEDVAYQRAAIEIVQEAGVAAQAVKVGIDKRARLMQAAVFISRVRFPRKGCEDLIAQLLGFGVEEHDDLVDGFVQLVLGINRVSGMQPLDVIALT